MKKQIKHLVPTLRVVMHSLFWGYNRAVKASEQFQSKHSTVALILFTSSLSALPRRAWERGFLSAHCDKKQGFLGARSLGVLCGKNSLLHLDPNWNALRTELSET